MPKEPATALDSTPGDLPRHQRRVWVSRSGHAVSLERGAIARPAAVQSALRFAHDRAGHDLGAGQEMS